MVPQAVSSERSVCFTLNAMWLGKIVKCPSLRFHIRQGDDCAILLLLPLSGRPSFHHEDR